ncbi:MAG: putative Acyl-CoA dehydrogenase [Frankiales bacterium]|nr:putative Acyl-CoA dehydrogenase [Frankiales bacterium]
MSDEIRMLTDAVGAIMTDRCQPGDVGAAEAAGWAPRLWDALAEAGFPWIAVDEAVGGTGGSMAEACAMLMTAGTFAAPLPLVETGLLAGWALAAVGSSIPPGPVTAAPSGPDLQLLRDGATWRLTGRLYRVPWASHCARLVTIVGTSDGEFVLALDPARGTITPGRNLAGEPRDTVAFDQLAVGPDEIWPAPAGVSARALLLRGALGRAALMAGALSRVSSLTLRYTSERQQFGRPVARFQAVQQHLVRIAEEATLTEMAVRTAAANSRPDPLDFDVAATKTVAGQAATTVAAAAHEAHGAIGMTREYELGQLTRRLWSWRDEYGSERYWSRQLGQRLIGNGAEQLWPALSVGVQP